MPPPFVMLTATDRSTGTSPRPHDRASCSGSVASSLEEPCQFRARSYSCETSEEVGHGRAAQLLNPTPGRKVNGPLLHSFQVAPDAPPLTHPENRYRAFVFSALVRSYLRPHRSSEERSPPRAANV